MKQFRIVVTISSVIQFIGIGAVNLIYSIKLTLLERKSMCVPDTKTFYLWIFKWFCYFLHLAIVKFKHICSYGIQCLAHSKQFNFSLKTISVSVKLFYAEMGTAHSWHPKVY